MAVPFGKAISKNVLAKTQKECKEKLTVALEQTGKVDAHKTDQFAVGQWEEMWFENYAKPSIRETTAAYYICWADVAKLRQYQRQYQLLREYRIDNDVRRS